MRPGEGQGKTALTGTGLMQSRQQWEIRNDVLATTLTELIGAHRSAGAADALDVGAQSGSLMDRYAELTGLRWIGIDPAFEAEGKSPAGATLLPGSADKLDFSDGSFDVIMLANVYEHIDPARRLDSMREIRRVLRPGGVVVGQIPNPYFPIENHSRLPFTGYLPVRAQKVYWRLSPVPWEHDFHVVTPRHLRRDAAAAGLRERVVRRFNYPVHTYPTAAQPVVRALRRPMARWMPWAWQFVLARD